MGLDLITQRDCEIKEQIPQIELLNLLKERSRGQMVLKMLTDSGKTLEEALDTSFSQSLQTLNGVQTVKVKVADLIEKTNHLQVLAKKCENCPISQNKDFGCIGFISYPISYECEKWLAGLTDAAIKKGLPFTMTLTFIEDQKITGLRIKEMRSHGQTFLESSNSTEIVISKSFFKKKTIDTNQLLEVTFLNGVMQTTHINYLLMLFGGIVSLP